MVCLFLCLFCYFLSQEVHKNFHSELSETVCFLCRPCFIHLFWTFKKFFIPVFQFKKIILNICLVSFFFLFCLFCLILLYLFSMTYFFHYSISLFYFVRDCIKVTFYAFSIFKISIVTFKNFKYSWSVTCQFLVYAN